MFGNIRIKSSKPQPRKAPSKSRFAIVRLFTDKIYRDPYRWDLLKCVAFFAASIYAARTLSQMEILPGDPPQTSPASH